LGNPTLAVFDILQ